MLPLNSVQQGDLLVGIPYDCIPRPWLMGLGTMQFFLLSASFRLAGVERAPFSPTQPEAAFSRSVERSKLRSRADVRRSALERECLSRQALVP
jgi:hypothetical protein